MANLAETSSYDSGVYQIETTDPVVGGSSGLSNVPLKNLANRTKYLKEHVDALENSMSGTAPINSPTFTGSPTAPTQALGDSTTKLANTDFVQKTIGGKLTKAVTGGSNVTLTAVEAGNGILEFTGVLTANIAVIVPGAPTRSWIIKNSTSGPYTITVRTSGGTGPVCSQGYNAQVWTDGTNCYDARTDFDAVALTGNSTATTPALHDNDTSVATTAFVRAELLGLSDAAYDAIFGKTLSTNGYQKLPSGLIIQWGTHAGINSSSGVNVIFPVSFPNACFAVVATHQAPGAGPGSRIVEVVIRGLTYFDAYGNTTSNAIYWLAIGF